MATAMKRMSLTISQDIDIEIKELKKQRFYSEPQSELLRYLLRLGIQREKELQKEGS